MTATESAPASITSRALARSDSADSHQRKVTNCLPDGPQSFETKHRSGVALGGGREDWTDREIVDRKFRSFDGLLDVVGRVTNDGLRTQELSRCFRRHVVLAQMNTTRAHSQRHVHAVVDDQLHAALRSNRNSGFGLLVKLSRRHLLLAQLHQRSPTTTQQPHLLRMRKPRQCDVSERVNFSEFEKGFAFGVNAEGVG